MKGPEIEQRFFFEWVLPFVTARFPALAPRLAAGVFSGSQTIGADDEVSRDHDWGPRCTLFLPDEDFQREGKQVQDQANAAAPREFQGHRMQRSWDPSVTVDSIDRFLEDSIGFASPPVHSRDWLMASGPTPADVLHRDANLYMLRHGPIYYDPLGELSARRAAFTRYPADVYYFRLATEAFRVWHHGEYNFVERLVHREDPLAIQMALGEFIQGVMRLGLLLSGDYAPYWKWLAFAFRALPEANRLEPGLRSLVESTDVDDQARTIRSICDVLRVRLLDLGLIKQKDADLMGYAEIIRRCEDRFFWPKWIW